MARSQSKGKKAEKRPASELDAVTQGTARAFAQRDGRVIERELSVLQFNLAATEDHIAGLNESLVAVKRKKAAVQAQIAGLTSVLARR